MCPYNNFSVLSHLGNALEFTIAHDLILFTGKDGSACVIGHTIQSLILHQLLSRLSILFDGILIGNAIFCKYLHSLAVIDKIRTWRHIAPRLHLSAKLYRRSLCRLRYCQNFTRLVQSLGHIPGGFRNTVIVLHDSGCLL